MKTRTLLLAAVALLAACVPDDPRRLLTETDAEIEEEAAPDWRAEAMARVKRLGCAVEEDGTVRCPDTPALGRNAFPSVEAMWGPRPLWPKKKVTEWLETVRRAKTDEPDDFIRYLEEVLLVEDAMLRAGCETVEDRCADLVRAAFGWNGYGPPGWPDGPPGRSTKGRALPPTPEMVRGLEPERVRR